MCTWGSSALLVMIRSTDPDFRICQIDFRTLLDIQLDAEEFGWSTRWSSIDALRGQVREESVFLQSFMREDRQGVVRAYRCLLLFSSSEREGGGGIATVDLDPKRFFSLERIDRDPDVRKALVRMFSLAMGGINMVSKN